MKPTIGRIVHYKLNANDAEQVNKISPGNHAEAGEVFPAIIVRTWGNTDLDAPYQLQVFPDAQGTLWVTSRHGVAEGDEHALGTWMWPPRV